MTSSASARRARAWETDGRSAPDELPEQPVRERERQADAAQLDLAPARGEVPQHERQADLQPRLAGDGALHVEVLGALARATQQGQGDLRPRPHALGEAGVEHGDARRDEDVPGLEVLEQVVAGRRRGLQEIAGARELGGGPVADLHLHGDDAVQQQQAQAARPGLQPLGRRVLADRDLEHHDGRHLARDDAHAQVELLGQVRVGVEQVAVRGLRAEAVALHGVLGVA